ncbi:single-stranded DNA-binding protein [Seonamhaeicola sp. S2-3]|uniref:single-stranded DNA-binding protein n=1 Tax=Seonamhaeicola sp. S2-3 TaxID=1936081 RepID=UPI000972D75E|nr:single-stranded DNA-binding protein [Seonamhaeicola sp. S2-3]APY10690.1 single-stranded DNA-binding protein [Seonamhaeicola sp. S2-3]
MSGTLNKVMLIGHLGDEVKMHYFEGGGCVGRFPLATNETYTNRQTNERISNTEWHNIVVRNKGAEICEKYLSKGDKVYIEGRLKTRKWQDDNGNERYSTEIQCTDFTFLTTKKESENNAASTTADQTPVAKDKPASEPTEDENDDLPF